MSEVPTDTLIDGRYRVLSRLGAGGMADVYCAEDTHLGRQVALKILYKRFAQDVEFVERFKREAQAAAGLTHPNVVRVYDRGEHDGTYYIAMEYVPGRTLKEVVAEGPLPEEAVVDVGVQMLRAASFAHRRGIVHRDLKPHNVMLDDSGGAKVTDFGIARAGASEMTEAGAVMGTAQYLSPEQAQGHGTTSQSDLYSIGIVLYELLTGRLPFDGETAVSIALQHLNDRPTPIAALRPDVSPALAAVVMRALEKDPAARWTDADEFAQALEGARDTLGAEPLGQDTASYPPLAAAPVHEAEAVAEPEEEERRRRWPWLALGLAALLLALAAVLLLGGDEEVPDVVGQPLAIASLALEDAGFEAEVERRPDRAPVEQVIAQDPEGGARAESGSLVRLVVSSGPGEVTIPSVAGYPERRAVRTLSRAGCRARDDTDLCGFRVEVREESSSDVEEGRAIRTSPDGGSRAEVGSRVLLYVSSGLREVEVPDVVGLARESAQSTLDRAGLGFTISEQESDSPPGTVLAQDPGGGTVVEEGARVRLTIATEPEQVAVPNVVGDTEEVARAKLRGAGFDVRVTERESPEDGIVLDQDPDGGEDADPGRTVRIVVGRAPPPPEEEGGAEIPPGVTPGAGAPG